MATLNEQLELVMGKAIAEPTFRQQLLADPERALKDARLDLSSEALAKVKSLKREDLAAIAQDIDARISKCAGSAAPGVDFCYIH